MRPRASVGLAPSRRGFTLIELLYAMALIVFVMAILSQAFVAGLESFRRLKGIGDLNEGLRADVRGLDARVRAAGRSALEFVEDGLRRGSVDPEEADALRVRYEAICADAVDLEDRLWAVVRETVNPAARRLLLRALEDLGGVKAAAARMVDLLEWIELARWPGP